MAATHGSSRRRAANSVGAAARGAAAPLVFNTLGRTPRRGESIHVPGYEIVVADLSRNRVSQVQIIEKPPEPAPEPAG